MGGWDVGPGGGQTCAVSFTGFTALREAKDYYTAAALLRLVDGWVGG